MHLEVTVEKAKDLPNRDKSLGKRNDVSDPYVVVHIVGKKQKKKKFCQTPTVKDSLNPRWDYTLSAGLDDEVSEILFTVYDKDVLKDDKLGFASVPATSFHQSKSTGFHEELQLINDKKQNSGKLTVSIKYSGT